MRLQNLIPRSYDRAEFADAIIRAAREVQDPALADPRANRRVNNVNNNANEKQYRGFDVSQSHKYYESINSAFDREIISGRGWKVLS